MFATFRKAKQARFGGLAIPRMTRRKITSFPSGNRIKSIARSSHISFSTRVPKVECTNSTSCCHECPCSKRTLSQVRESVRARHPSLPYFEYALSSEQAGDVLADFDLNNATMVDIHHLNKLMPAFNFRPNLHNHGTEGVRTTISTASMNFGENGLDMTVALSSQINKHGFLKPMSYRPNYGYTNGVRNLPYFEVTFFFKDGKQEIKCGWILGYVPLSHPPTPPWKKNFPEGFLQDSACFLDEDKQLWGLIPRGPHSQTREQVHNLMRKERGDGCETDGLSFIMSSGGSSSVPSTNGCIVHLGSLFSLQQYRATGKPMTFHYPLNICKWTSKLAAL